jgi:hypothetical protein
LNRSKLRQRESGALAYDCGAPTICEVVCGPCKTRCELTLKCATNSRCAPPTPGLLPRCLIGSCSMPGARRPLPRG